MIFIKDREEYIMFSVHAIAAGLSYAINKSISWAILHFFLGWIYLAYQLCSMYLIK